MGEEGEYTLPKWMRVTGYCIPEVFLFQKNYATIVMWHIVQHLCISHKNPGSSPFLFLLPGRDAFLPNFRHFRRFCNFCMNVNAYAKCIKMLRANIKLHS